MYHPPRIDEDDDEIAVNDQDVQRLIIVTQVDVIGKNGLLPGWATAACFKNINFLWPSVSNVFCNFYIGVILHTWSPFLLEEVFLWARRFCMLVYFFFFSQWKLLFLYKIKIRFVLSLKYSCWEVSEINKKNCSNFFKSEGLLGLCSGRQLSTSMEIKLSVHLLVVVTLYLKLGHCYLYLVEFFVSDKKQLW